jgi:hypothetical protein
MYLALVVRQFVIQVSPFNLHRNNLVEMSTVSTYNILSYKLPFRRKQMLMSSFKSCIGRKSQSFPKSLKKYTTSELGVELSTFVPCERRWSWYRMIHCHFARWKTLVVVPYDILPCEIHWLCYRMAHCHVALVVVPYGALSCCTGCSTVWHIVRWKALVVVPHDTLLGCTGRGTIWHIASWNTLVVIPYDILLGCTGRCTTWHIANWKGLVVVPYNTLPCEIHWLWYRMTHC